MWLIAPEAGLLIFDSRPFDSKLNSYILSSVPYKIASIKSLGNSFQGISRSIFLSFAIAYNSPTIQLPFGFFPLNFPK